MKGRHSMKSLIILGVSCIAFASENTPALTSDVDVLHTKSFIEPLASATPLAIDESRSLILEPGVRATRTDDTFNFTTHGNSFIQIVTENEHLVLASPVIAQLNGARLDFGNGKFYDPALVTLRRIAQDDTDSNLKSMQESAKKLKAKNNGNQDSTAHEPGKKLRYRWLYQNNPNPTSELFNQPAIQQLTHLSAIGF